jgi:hypothetical protein
MRSTTRRWRRPRTGWRRTRSTGRADPRWRPRMSPSRWTRARTPSPRSSSPSTSRRCRGCPGHGDPSPSQQAAEAASAPDLPLRRRLCQSAIIAGQARPGATRLLWEALGYRRRATTGADAALRAPSSSCAAHRERATILASLASSGCAGAWGLSIRLRSDSGGPRGQRAAPENRPATITLGVSCLDGRPGGGRRSRRRRAAERFALDEQPRAEANTTVLDLPAAGKRPGVAFEGIRRPRAGRGGLRQLPRETPRGPPRSAGGKSPALQPGSAAWGPVGWGPAGGAFEYQPSTSRS